MLTLLAIYIMLTLLVIYVVGGIFCYISEIQHGESDVAVWIAIFYPLTMALALLVIVGYPFGIIGALIYKKCFPTKLECQHDYEATTYRTLPRCMKCK
jgi:hypothetical protein